MLRRFLNSIKGISSSSLDVSLSCLYFLDTFAKGTLSSESDSFSVSDSEGCGGITYAAPLNFLLLSCLENMPVIYIC